MRQNPVPIPMKILDKSMKEYDFKYGLKYIEDKRFGFMCPDLEPLSLSDIVGIFTIFIKNDSRNLIENLRAQVNNSESKLRGGAIYNNSDIRE